MKTRLKLDRGADWRITGYIIHVSDWIIPGEECTKGTATVYFGCSSRPFRCLYPPCGLCHPTFFLSFFFFFFFFLGRFPLPVSLSNWCIITSVSLMTMIHHILDLVFSSLTYKIFLLCMSIGTKIITSRNPAGCHRLSILLLLKIFYPYEPRIIAYQLFVIIA